MSVIDLTKNVKQAQFYDVVMNEVAGVMSAHRGEIYETPGYRNLFYGGAIRGGKTFVSLFILIMLCKMFKGSRWHVIRESGTSLQATTIPSMQKLLKHSKVRWSNKAGDKYVEFAGGSRIYFMAEMYAQDKELDRFKGLETNGFLLEQLEELQKKTYFKCIERSGSWYDCEIMPPALNLATFNPTWAWLKEEIYDKHRDGALHSPFFYMNASPKDNPFVTADQWKQWELLDDESRAMFIEGDWDIKLTDVFFYAFNTRQHIDDRIKLIPEYDLWLSFDFNVDPMTCIVAQTDHNSFLNVLKEYRIENGDTYAACEAIKEDWGMYNPYYKVTGDATGRNRMSGTRGAINHYQIIMEELSLGPEQMEVPKFNPFVTDSRTFCNSILKSLEALKISQMNCPFLVKDLRFTEIDRTNNGKIDIKKKGPNRYAGIDNERMTHLGDCFRYLCHSTLTDFLTIPKS